MIKKLQYFMKLEISAYYGSISNLKVDNSYRVEIWYI